MLVSIFAFLLFFTSLFMVLLILIQRGKGGGLAGAFGGAGGQSAFGTKAGDMFTKITVVTAVIWFFLSISTILSMKGCGQEKKRFGDDPLPPASSSSSSESGTENSEAAPAPASDADADSEAGPAN